MMDIGGTPSAWRSGRWFWHSGLQPGDVVALDALRCPHTAFTLEGEQQLASACASAQRVRAALEGQGNASSLLQEALELCGGLGEVLPETYPLVGGRYLVDAKPGALVRRHESVESEVSGEILPGGVVTVLEVGRTEVGRTRIYTEHARLLAVGSTLENGGALPEHDPGTSLTGWIASATYDGAPLLRPLSLQTSAQPRPELAARSARLGSLMQGICAWANVTLSAPPGRGSASTWHVERTIAQHARLLGAQIEEAQAVAVEVRCVAAVAWSRGQVAAASWTLLALLAGAAALRRRARRRSTAAVADAATPATVAATPAAPTAAEGGVAARGAADAPTR